MADGWPVAAPDTAGMDATILCGVVGRVRAGELPNVHGVLVARRGTLVLEEYFAGPDEHRGRRLGVVEFGPRTLHDLRSVSKSVVSLLFGIARAEGKIGALDRPVLDHFPEYADLRTPEKSRIELQHILTMTMGVEWDENRSYRDPLNSETQMDAAPDRYRFVLTRPAVTPPGETYRYNGGATALIAAVVQRATGRKLVDYARDVLFRPLGIDDAEWITYPDGDPIAASGLRLRPRDLAKIGQLYLSGGRWDGRPVAPADWLRESIRPKVDLDGGGQYGYQWWLGRSTVRDRTVAWAAARGNGGQALFVVPDLELLVVVTAGNYNDPSLRRVPLDILDQHVLPAVRPAP
jgi:CubicO group peptidase (beta-lactamase class C family)